MVGRSRLCSMRTQSNPTSQGVTFAHPWAFWAGTLSVFLGVAAHMPTFVMSAPMGYQMKDMAMSGVMLGGMGLILLGLALAVYGIVPFGNAAHGVAETTASRTFQAMDTAHLTRQHWGLLVVLGVALLVDVMKPATLGFVVPGMRAEYGMTARMVALFPLTALTGTTIGSVMWGLLSDRVGRRAAILLASILFMATSICGFMPSFRWNLFMCFIMGISAGGMLPIVYALMTESMPAHKRGWLVVLHGGLGTVGGYLLASGLATLLEPQFSWRILWFAGLPTGLLMLVLNRWIPESPRFLLERGRIAEAAEVMRRYGVEIIDTQTSELEREPAVRIRPASSLTKIASLFRHPYLIQTMSVGLYGLGWGLVNWGFITFTPTILRDRGIDAGGASKLLFQSALIAVPATILVAYLYGMWSSRKSMILFALITTAALIVFAIVDPGGHGHGIGMLMPLMVAVLVGTGGIISMLSPYTAEIYPTALRGTGSGFAAGSSKIGGMFAPPVAAALLATSPGFRMIGIIVAIPVALSAMLLLFAGVETRDRGLEELTGPSEVRTALLAEPTNA